MNDGTITQTDTIVRSIGVDRSHHLPNHSADVMLFHDRSQVIVETKHRTAAF